MLRFTKCVTVPSSHIWDGQSCLCRVRAERTFTAENSIVAYNISHQHKYVIVFPLIKRDKWNFPDLSQLEFEILASVWWVQPAGHQGVSYLCRYSIQIPSQINFDGVVLGWVELQTNHRRSDGEGPYYFYFHNILCLSNVCTVSAT